MTGTLLNLGRKCIRSVKLPKILKSQTWAFLEFMRAMGKEESWKEKYGQLRQTFIYIDSILLSEKELGLQCFHPCDPYTQNWVIKRLYTEIADAVPYVPRPYFYHDP